MIIYHHAEISERKNTIMPYIGSLGLWPMERKRKLGKLVKTTPKYGILKKFRIFEQVSAMGFNDDLKLYTIIVDRLQEW
jgi:hypothetical protein